MIRFQVPLSRIVTFTTDFGAQDAYVPAMKGAVLSRAPGASLIDISHLVPPQDIRAGGFILRQAVSQFPRDAIHVAVVDPGVGTERRGIAVTTAHGSFVGPDNGLLYPVIAALDGVDMRTGSLLDVVAVSLEARQFQAGSVSRTFHGRDIFAPAAGWLAAGESILSLGTTIDRIVPGNSDEAHLEGTRVRGEVVYIDHYGNAITDIPERLIPRAATVSIGNTVIPEVSRTYRDARVLALVGSAGTLEISVRDGSAVRELGIYVGQPVEVRLSP